MDSNPIGKPVYLLCTFYNSSIQKSVSSYITYVPIEALQNRGITDEEIEYQKNASVIVGDGREDRHCLYMVENDDRTVSFRSKHNGLYLRVNFHSSDSKAGHINKSQLYFSGTEIWQSNQEKFYLEESLKGDSTFKLKSTYNNSYIYMCSMNGRISNYSFCANSVYNAFPNSEDVLFKIES